MKVAGLVVAAGRGERAGAGLPKQYRPLDGKPVLLWSLETMAAAGLGPLVTAISSDHQNLFDEVVAGGPPANAVPGGETRTASVRAGLDALAAAAPDVVLIHDAARPGLTANIIQHLCAEIAAGADGAAPALPLADSLRRVDGAGRVTGEADRAGLMRVQTPQAFRYGPIRAAYAALPADAAPTDDIAVAVAAGLNVRLIPGDLALMKLTFAEDVEMLERMLGQARVTCVGTGFDAHRFGEGDHVTLCGVRIAHDRGLLGHSDADAGWHALVDAILGALGEGDIGAHFPPSDPQWKGADSEKFLRHAVKLATERGARIEHVDLTLICERPKIGPHRDAMRARTAEVLGLPLTRVSVKATTTERMGFTGREEGLAAQATATLACPR
ncbi:MAG: bifunctional 2-C-methyl-D-erythritol 4-phosphate cytidylyltransferase/2-C-methyl-D-erythritol 2,4-cyclodiphosphate synthase [Hyphomonadaceae bacterium]|nr:bifunctional 2-C-methyl-D-erythritol 4-phosphate cytidylyltransferase/2-C-methyl-D-erythritol 2,4-cyclodiphosphate synthase [Hyphomonadaceae bacterium]